MVWPSREHSVMVVHAYRGRGPLRGGVALLRQLLQVLVRSSLGESGVRAGGCCPLGGCSVGSRLVGMVPRGDILRRLDRV